ARVPELVHRRAYVRADRLPHSRHRVGYAPSNLLDVRSYALGDRSNVGRFGRFARVDRAESRLDRAAVRMPHHHDEPRAKLRDGELNGADARRSDHVAGDPNDEQIPEPLIEHELGRSARVRAPENGRERGLSFGEPGAPAGSRNVLRSLDEPLVAEPKA